MENITHVVFSRILTYATNNNYLLKQVVSWERVSKVFAGRLMVEFWPSVQNTFVQFVMPICEPFSMQIGKECYKSIELAALIGLKKRGIGRSRIFFFEYTSADFVLPSGFAAAVPSFISIGLGCQQNLNDPELLRILETNCAFVEGFYFFISNPTISDHFMNVISTFDSLKRLTLYSHTLIQSQSKIRKKMFAKLTQFLRLECLIIISMSSPGLQSIFDNELFAALQESKTIKCLHLRCFNHYVERWLANNFLQNRAQITNLCITNDQFGYSAGELENRGAPLFHTLTEYQLLFPKLKYICIGICLVQFDDSRLDSMLQCYFLNSSFNIKICLTIRLYHKLEEVSMERFDWVFAKLRAQQAEISIIKKNKQDITIKIRSKNGYISSEIEVCFDYKNVQQAPIKYRYNISREKNKCVDFDHCGRYSNNCLCAIN